jgi:hypothetical protein
VRPPTDAVNFMTVKCDEYCHVTVVQYITRFVQVLVAIIES